MALRNQILALNGTATKDKAITPSGDTVSLPAIDQLHVMEDTGSSPQGAVVSAKPSEQHKVHLLQMLVDMK